MRRQNKKIAARPASFVPIITLVIMIAGLGCKKQSTEQTQLEQNYNESTQSQPTNQMPIKPPTNIATGSKTTLDNVIRTAKTWGPAYQSWHGKHAPDFTLFDINGKQHKLSDYHGKNVMLIFWATWCQPCLIEIPHLIELRKTISEEELAMLAITKERPELVKKFVTRNEMNYTVLTDRGTLPRPYNRVNAIPSSFFIDPQGRIKLATMGLIQLNTIKAILKAETNY